MPRVQFNVEPNAELKSAYGYAVEVTKDGVFGDVPDELVASEVAAGRVKAPEVTEAGVFGDVPDELVASEVAAGRVKAPEVKKPAFKKDEE